MGDSRVIIPVLVLFLVLTIPIIAETTFAKPADLPDPAKVTVAPLKVRIIEYEGITAVFKPYYTFLDDPGQHETPIGGVFDGTGKLVILRDDIGGVGRGVGCSGTLLLGGLHVLTAAHCVAGSSGGSVWKMGSNVTFTGSSGDVTRNFTSATIHPDYTGDIIRGNDIAVIELNSTADGITTYDIDRNKKDDVGAIGNKVGYGISGLFADGTDKINYPFGTKRDGLNKYDDTADTMYKALRFQPGKDFPRNTVLQYDLDSGLEENDAFDFFFRNSDLGLGDNEAGTASGDSGGSTFTTNSNGDKIITGVTSYGVTLVYIDGRTSDCHTNYVGEFNIPDSSCGEFAGDTSVAMYSDFIDSVTGGGGDEPVDEPNCPQAKKDRGKC